MNSPFVPTLNGTPCEVPPGHNPEYYQLPASVQALHTYEQWLWFNETEKALLVQRECEPEVDL